MKSRLSLRIPSDVFRFFTNPGGHSLILNGAAGTGKTTFALQTIEDMSELERSYYVSTRVSDDSLFTQFPWLRANMGRGGVGLDEVNGNNTRSSRSGLKGLKGFDDNAINTSSGEMSVSIGRELMDIEAIYEAVESNLPERSLVVIDSIDAMAEKYEISCSNLISTMQKDVVEHYGTNAIFVVENIDPQLDYLADGLVKLNTREYRQRRIREMDIIKLRGCEIFQPKYLYTLKGGKLRSFGLNDNLDPINPESWTPISDLEGGISSGIMDLDRLLDGGLERGSITLIELGDGIPTSFTRILEASLVSNFISLGRGVFWVPLHKASTENSKNYVVNAIDEALFDRLVRIPISANQSSMLSAKHIMAVEGLEASTDMDWKNIEYSLQGAESPFLSLICFDTMESIYGGDLMDKFMGHLAAIKSNNSVFVGITSPSTRSNERLTDLANVHIKIDRIGGTIIMYGEEPFTGCNAITYGEKEIGGCVILTQIV